MKHFKTILQALLIALLVITYALPAHAVSLAQQLSGKILLQVESNGEAWYIYPESNERYYMGRPTDAFELMRSLGLGISNANLALIPEAGSNATGNLALRKQVSGKILLQVEENGEAWYVYPNDLKRYFLGRPADAFALMRQLGLGISNENLLSIPIALTSVIPDEQQNKSNGSITIGDVGDGLDSIRNELAASLNAERTRNGLSALRVVREVSVAAQNQADDMTTRQYFDFTTPEGDTIATFLFAQNYVAHVVAENLIQTNRPVTEIVSVWQTQETASLANLLDSEYEDLGIGIGEYQGVPIYTIVFARSLDSYFSQETVKLQNLEAVRIEMLTFINEQRSNAGLPTVQMNELLHQAAQGHTDDMLFRSFYAHGNPEGQTSHERIVETGYQPRASGENIAKGQFSVQEVMEDWMQSEGHRANILSPNFTEVGIGLSFGKNQNGYEVIWAQNFAAPL